MEPSEYRGSKPLSQLILQSQFLKKLTQVIVSVCMFSFFFSHISLPSFLFPQSPFRIVSHSIDKIYVFLLCTGLLVFIANFSCFKSPFRRQDDAITISYVSFFKNYQDGLESVGEGKMLENENDALVKQEKSDYCMIREEGVEERESKKKPIVENEEQKGRTGFSAEENEADKKEQERKLQGETQEVVELSEGNGMPSTEELNEKFEEFIRKMKEQLRIEARRQLVMV